MKTQLEEYIEREAEELPESFHDFKAGAYLLLPLLLDAIEALKFYSDSDNWGHVDKNTAIYKVMGDEDLGQGGFKLSESVDDDRVAGLKARQTLESINERIGK